MEVIYVTFNFRRLFIINYGVFVQDYVDTLRT